MASTANSQVEELTPTVTSLEALGFQIVSLRDEGAFGFVATFKKEKLEFSIVKDRGFWHLAGGDEELSRSPSRKSRRQVTDDAIDWIKRKTPNQSLQPTAAAGRG